MASQVASGTRSSTAKQLIQAFDGLLHPGDLESFFHAGSLDFSADDVAHVTAVHAAAPTVIDVYLDRPAILTPLTVLAGSLIVNFGSSDEAFARVLFGEAEPKGRLPFELPSSMEAVAASRPDVPSDTNDPLFTFGAGLRYLDWTPSPRPTQIQKTPRPWRAHTATGTGCTAPASGCCSKIPKRKRS